MALGSSVDYLIECRRDWVSRDVSVDASTSDYGFDVGVSCCSMYLIRPGRHVKNPSFIRGLGGRLQDCHHFPLSG